MKRNNRNEGKIRKKRWQIQDDLTETKGYWRPKNEALDRTLCRTRFEPVFRQIM